MADLERYLLQVENAVDDESVLLRLRREALTDASLDEHQSNLILGRIGQYLADIEKARPPLDVLEPTSRG